jgi:flagellar protein FlaI
VEGIREKLGGRYDGVLVTESREIKKLRNELLRVLGKEVGAREVEEYIYDNMSLGKLTPLLLRDDLEEIMVIGSGLPVYVYQRGRGMQKTDITLKEEEVREIIDRIARFSGRRVDKLSPLLDARLPDGSRVNVTLPEVTPRGSTITIRRFRRDPPNIRDIISQGAMNSRLAGFLWVAVEGLRAKPANILISGGSASGKTTILNVLSTFVPEDERILTVEDILEVSLPHKHWVPMETRPPLPGFKEVAMDDLVKNALRMRPDRILVGEVRAEEALTLFTAMNTGHEGCMATIHANSAREAILRLRSHPMNVPNVMLSALDLIISQQRLSRGSSIRRRVMEVVEIGGKEGDVITTNTLFKYDPSEDMIKERLINGKFIHKLSALSNLSVREIDEEVERREAILETISKSSLSTSEIHELIQLYYRNPDEAVEELYSKIKSLA